jgi:hypothetical protein
MSTALVWCGRGRYEGESLPNARVRSWVRGKVGVASGAGFVTQYKAMRTAKLFTRLLFLLAWLAPHPLWAADPKPAPDWGNIFAGWKVKPDAAEEKKPGPRQDGAHRPYIADAEAPEVPHFFTMSMTQTGLDPTKSKNIDDYKSRMLQKTFDYGDNRQVSGLFHPGSGTYFVSEGHHRLAAALEIARETGNWSPFKKLIQNGYWGEAAELPGERHRLAMRSGWLNKLSCRALISLVTPGWGALFHK